MPDKFDSAENILTKKYNKLVDAGANYFTTAKLRLLKKAFSFIKPLYIDKKESITGINLAESVLDISLCSISEVGIGTSAVLAILLFEAFENDFIDLVQIEKEYSAPVARICRDLSEISKLNTHTVFSKNFNTEILPLAQKSKRAKKYAPTAKIHYGHQAENFRKLFLSLAADMRVILIKLAQELYLIRNIKKITHNKQLTYCREAYYMYAPIAHQLGLYNLKTEFEETGMKYLESDMYQHIAHKLDETKKLRDTYIKSFIEPIKVGLKKKDIQAEIKGRPKSIHSIWNKMKGQNMAFEGIYDLFAIRIIIDGHFETIKEEKNTCWDVYSMITDFWQPNPKRLRDWISSPKTSGYESLHTTVLGPENKWVEVQIRTRRMDDIAEKGQAAHWKYKEIKGDKGHNDWLVKIREILENPELENQQDNSSKSELYSDDIFVFTPKGEIRKLRKGATVLDFAYAIHTHLGEQCTGAKVNGVLAGLKTELKNGDKISILTSKTQRPKKEWLNFVASPSAKSRIKRFLNHEIHQKAEKGKLIFLQQIDNLKANQQGLKLPPFDKMLSKLKWYFKINGNAQFFSALEEEKIKISDNLLHKFFVEPERIGYQDMVAKLKELAENNEVAESKDFLYIDEKLSGIDFELAKCCNPIPGDNIFGFVTVMKGTRIHKLNCPNAREMISRFPYRIVRAKWRHSGNNQFSASIKVLGENTTGVVSDISTVISHDKKINMTAINVKANEDSMFEGEITVNIYDTNHLDELLVALKKIKGILKVYRI